MKQKKGLDLGKKRDAQSKDSARPKKERLDLLLVERGLAESRAKAQALILAGQVLVEPPKEMRSGPQLSEIKAGSLFSVESKITLKKVCPYVSRGGQKLEFALDYFKISVEDKICFDVGASTGGFSDCLLQRGGKFVYALDVGHGQLHPKIRQDHARVQVYEKTHIVTWKPDWPNNKVPSFVTVDVSFISLFPVLKRLSEILPKPGTEILALIKPQFEVGQKFLKKGIVKDLDARAQAIQNIVAQLESIGLVQARCVACAVVGAKGNQEEWLHCIRS